MQMQRTECSHWTSLQMNQPAGLSARLYMRIVCGLQTSILAEPPVLGPELP